MAKRLGYRFFDTDKAIENKYRLTIPIFFSHYGEQAFRIVETKILNTTADMEDTVVSTGGGTPCSDANIRFVLEHGIVVHIQMSVDDIMERIAVAHKSRPSLEGMSAGEQRLFVAHKLEERMPYYRQAHLTVPALHATVDDLYNAIRQATPPTHQIPVH